MLEAAISLRQCLAEALKKQQLVAQIKCGFQELPSLAVTVLNILGNASHHNLACTVVLLIPERIKLTSLF